MNKKVIQNNKELKIRVTTKQMDWLKEQAEEYEGNVAFTVRKILEALMKD